MKPKAENTVTGDKKLSKEEMEAMEDPKEVERRRVLAENSEIYSNYYGDLDENLVYLESRDGEDFTGNLLRIAEELSKDEYNDLKICAYAQEIVKKEKDENREEIIIIEEPVKEKILELQKNYNLKIDEIVTNDADATKVAEKAKYIVSDSGIRPRYVKKEGQLFLYTAHGTPFKTMGVHNHSEEHTIGSVQHPMLSADYILYPNEYMKEKMLSAYMLEKILPGKILLEGYPRNSVFFDDERREEIKNELKLNNEEIFLYLPTFKGTYFDRLDEEQDERLKNYFTELDKKLNDKQVLIVKLHHLNESNIDYTDYKHIKPFPKGYETYDIVNLADVLITDYSSVFFDFANTKRKIILFNYDEEEYMSYRGTYFPLSDLPFPKVQNVEDLVKELNSPKEYEDDEFLEKYCTYDNPNATENICKHMFKGEKVCKEEEIKENGKPKLLIYAGGLLNNGITTSFVNLLKSIDRTKYNIFISYNQQDWSIRKYHRHLFNIIPDDVEFLPLRSKLNITTEEEEIYKEFLGNKDEDAKYPKYIDKVFKRDLDRCYPKLKFDNFIHFDGYGKNTLLTFKHLDCKRSVWVHTDMVQEIETKRSQHFGTLKEVYGEYDNVVVVSPELIEPTSKFVDKDKIRVVHNINNYKENLEKAEQEISIDKYTRLLTHNTRSIKGVLESPGKKFVTIGKFKNEKGHMRLINAFEEFCKDYPDAQLIIIGGHGDYFKRTKKLRDKSKYWKNITFIHWISNPMPILKECDCFVLSSFYEGWPMTLMEAATIDMPIFATDVVGTQWVKENGGHLVENSEEGILKGFYEFAEGKIEPIAIDWEEYNKEALKEINSILDDY